MSAAAARYVPAVNDRVRVEFNPATGIGGATGVVTGLRQRSALVQWDGVDWADWIAVRRLARLP